MINSVVYPGATRVAVGRADVSRAVFGWHRPAAAAAAMSAARLATAGHVADIPQHKRIAENFASVNRGST
jgi:hypothetical protein